jgi:antitoxin CptB
VDSLIDERALSRLKWSCRRGLLENDLFIQRFFQTHEARLSMRQARGLQHLMDLSDNDLLDLLLRRSELSASMDRPEVREVLSQLRRPPPVSTSEGMTP